MGSCLSGNEAAFPSGKFEEGVIAGIRSVGAHLAQHYPQVGRQVNDCLTAVMIESAVAIETELKCTSRLRSAKLKRHPIPAFAVLQPRYHAKTLQHLLRYRRSGTAPAREALRLRRVGNNGYKH